MSKWLLTDPVTSETWTFVRSPFEMATPTRPHRTQVMPGGLAMRKGTLPSAWSFRGYLRTKEEYDTLLEWSKKPNAIEITDHVGRVHEVMPQSFDPVPRRARQGVPWRFEYTFRALYLRRVT